MGRWTFALSAFAFVGCAEPREEEATPPITTANDDDDDNMGVATSSASSPSTGEPVDDEDDDDVKLDIGFPGDTDGPPATSGDNNDQNGCDKVDFLFVIDNSGSMSEEQDNLVNNFPGFIDTIQATLDEAQDYHIMVVDTDPAGPVDCAAVCAEGVANGCINSAGLCEIFNPICLIGTCEPLGNCEPGGCAAPPPLDECDVMGAGVVSPSGPDSSNADCNFASGKRFMDASEPDLQSAFSCAARVGTGASGASEEPMGAIVQAVTPSTQAFACNDDFIRDDAILVVTFITDEDDDAGDGSSGNVEGWRQALISAKNGDDQAIVVLGLFGDGNCGEDSVRLTQFVESWGDRGKRGSVCAASYQEFFQEAVDLIDVTCDDFVPPVPEG